MSNPEQTGLDPERLARIDEHLESRFIQPKKIAGAAFAAQEGEESAQIDA